MTKDKKRQKRQNTQQFTPFEQQGYPAKVNNGYSYYPQNVPTNYGYNSFNWFPQTHYMNQLPMMNMNHMNMQQPVPCYYPQQRKCQESPPTTSSESTSSSDMGSLNMNFNHNGFNVNVNVVRSDNSRGSSCDSQQILHNSFLSNSMHCNSSNSSDVHKMNKESYITRSLGDRSTESANGWTDLDKKVLRLVVEEYTIKPSHDESVDNIVVSSGGTSPDPNSATTSESDQAGNLSYNEKAKGHEATEGCSKESFSANNESVCVSNQSLNGVDSDRGQDKVKARIMDLNGTDQPMPHDVVNWQKVCKHFAGRTPEECRQKWYEVKDLLSGKPSQAWKAKETIRLKELIKIFGNDNWAELACYMPEKTPVQCKERWESVLDPSRKRTPWTPDEISLLYAEQARLGNKWKIIASKLKGRTKTDVKNYWHSHAVKKAAKIKA